MTVNALILELQMLKDAGRGDLPVVHYQGDECPAFDSVDEACLSREYVCVAGVSKKQPCIVLA